MRAEQDRQMPFRQAYLEYPTHAELPNAPPHWEVLAQRSWRLLLIRNFRLGLPFARKPSSPVLSCQPQVALPLCNAGSTVGGVKSLEVKLPRRMIFSRGH